MKRTTKEVIIESLLNEDGISLSSVNQKIKSSYDRPFGYHSIYKAIRQLQEEGIILKHNQDYVLSGDWINSILDFSDKLRHHINKTSGLINSCSNPFEFKDIQDMHKFLRKIEKQHLLIFHKNHGGTVIWVVYHCYNYLLQPAKMLSYIKQLKECNVNLKILCYGNSPLDIWTKSAFEKYGVDIKLGAKVGGLTGMYIYDDVVAEIYYGRDFLNVVNDIYKNTSTINDLDLGTMFEKLSGIDSKINIMLYHNQNIIKYLKERSLSYF
ncbi:MAG: hypothetical protein ABIC04_00875 [Nanoarchaeota archaeon]